MEIDPNNALTPLLLGHVYKTIGQQHDAIICYQKSIKLNPGYGDPYWSLANLKTFQFYPELINQMQSSLSSTGIFADDAIHLHFALAKALEDKREFDISFEYYQKGNVLKKQQVKYDKHLMSKNFELQKQFFNKQYFGQFSIR